MSKSFKDVPQRYSKCEELTEDTKYKRGIDGYSERYGKAIYEKNNWKVVCFFLLLCNFIQTFGLIYVGTQSEIIPYIVEFDAQTGALIKVGKTTEKQEPNENQISYFVWEIVKKSRTLPKDLVMYKQNWEDVYSFLNDETSTKMNEFAIQSQHKEKLADGKTTQLQMKSFMKTKNNTYQVRWKESLYDSNGKLISETAMEGLFTVKQGTVTEDKIHINPLGLIVTDFSWSQER